MPLVSMTRLFEHALKNSYAVGYFEAWDVYSLEAVLEAAEAERAPVILGFGCMMVSQDWLVTGGIDLLGRMGRLVAERASVPVAFILNEAQTYEQIQQGINVGFNAVMLDTSAWEWDAATREVQQLVAFAHARGVSVEAELGRLPDAVEGGIDVSAASRTDPEQAAAFVKQTGIDCLAVSVGNVHLLTDGYAPVDMDLLDAIYRRVRIPLVMHGGTSFPPEAVPRAIAGGIAKFNVGTILKKTFLEGMREAMNAWPERISVHDVLGSHSEKDWLNAGKARMRAEVQKLIHLYGGSGQAF